MKLRPYQVDVKREIFQHWADGNRNTLLVMPTGAGKTVTLSDIVKDVAAPTAVIAHRQELVVQLSIALARDEVRHGFITADKGPVGLSQQLQMQELGRAYYAPNSPVKVIGVDTLLRRLDNYDVKRWMQSVELWVTDEAHHIAGGNKWMRAVESFPNAWGLGVTATPLRADGKGLGRHVDGVFDSMVVGPNMRELRGMGYLTDYIIYGPPSDIAVDLIPVSKATGDFTDKGVRDAVHKSRKIVGDVVEHYLRLAAGKRGVTFASDIETATKITAAYNAAGVPAALVTGNTPDAERVQSVTKLRSGALLQLVNVDIFGEGFDLPAIEVVSMARPTQSYGLFVQQFGRALRILEGKVRAIIIDHVGNVERMAKKYGLPDNPPAWTLDRRERNGSNTSGQSMVKTCVNPVCNAVYERFLSKCPHCGHIPEPAGRSSPEFVDGDLIELSPAALDSLREEIAQVDISPQRYQAILSARRVPGMGQKNLMRKHVARQQMQAALRESIAWWGAYQRAQHRPDSESYRRFYLEFGVDVMTAQTLNTAEALALAEKLNGYLARQ